MPPDDSSGARALANEEIARLLRSTADSMRSDRVYHDSDYYRQGRANVKTHVLPWMANSRGFLGR